MLNKIKNKFVNFLAKEDSTYHILAFIISSILFPSLPIIWFIIFMKEKMIFSYDFFTNGMFGLTTFFFFTIIFLLFLGFLLVGSLTLLVIYLYKKLFSVQEFRLYFWVVFIANIFVFLLVWFKIDSDFTKDLYTFIILVNVVIFVHIGVLFAGKGLHKIISLMIFSGVFIWLIMNYHHIISGFIEYSLLQFRMGGNIPTTIRNANNHQDITKGYLTLLTPNKVFLQTKNEMTVFNRENIIIKIMDINTTK